jgi:N-succinyldiaminopimelate aminotransferase
MNPDLDKLQPYPFERLNRLKQGSAPPPGLSPIALSIGEPKHATPGFVAETLATHLHTLASYPLTRGGEELRQAIADWLIYRFQLPGGSVDPDRHVLPANGTREALFAFAQAVVDRSQQPLIIMPNPFYQIYEGAVLLAGAEPWFMNTTAESGYLPDIDAVPDDIWQRCQLIYICTPGNPTGAVISETRLQQLIQLADTHDFIIASDECYSEIYPDEDKPPAGLLSAASNMGNTDFRRCVVFHSLSKRSNAPGLRSGFVAGDADVIQEFFRYRTYHGCAMAMPVQAASRAAWQDEQHVVLNRALYREKFEQVLPVLQPVLKVQQPDAGFYLWPETPVDDERFARELYQQYNVTVLPGSYLSRTAHDINPGAGHVRMALVPPLDECLDAAERIREYITRL